MTGYQLCREAQADLQAICATLTRDRPATARRMVRMLMESFERLEDFPELGHVVAGLAGDLTVRRLSVRDHTILYSPGATVVILRVLKR